MDRDATSAEVVMEEREPSTAVSLTARFETAALGAPASDESTLGTALGEPCSADCSSGCSLAASVASTVAIVAPRPANGAKANVTEVVPRFFQAGPRRARVDGALPKGSATAAEAQGAVPECTGCGDVPKLRPTVCSTHRLGPSTPSSG